MLDLDRNTVIIEVKCRWCGKLTYIEVYESDFEDFCNGRMRASDFHYLKSSERELLISQTCDDCWNKMFPDEDY